MNNKLETRKYVFTVEGETEQWYFEWLRDQINACPGRTCNVAIDAKVQQSPRKFYKSVNAKTTPLVTHICDIESNEPIHVDKFHRILSEMKEAKTQKRISFVLGYSNFTFELWMVLHKRDCNGPCSHRSNYLDPVQHAFGEPFENLDHYKQEDAFKRCLKKLTLDDVKAAIRRAEYITSMNESNKKQVIQYKGYSYYRENPALTIHKAVKKILKECGL